jgi:chemotaxis protein MotB
VAVATLQQVVNKLNEAEFLGRNIRIDGHTDDTPIKHSKVFHKSNWDLSAKRALTVLRFLESQGVASERLSFAGYGSFKPLDKGKGDRARTRNRRVEIVLYEN